MAGVSGAAGSAGSEVDGGAAVRGMVAYTRSGQVAEDDWRSWIAVADLAGSDRHEITPRPTKGRSWDDYNPVWSPDGSRLAFVRAERGNGSLYVANRDGTGLRRVLRVGPLAGGDKSDSPSWSPDGQRLAYGNGPLYVVNSDGTNSRKLVASSTCNPVWSPDGRSLLYLVDAWPCSERGGNASAPGYRSIYRIDADGTDRRRLAIAHVRKYLGHSFGGFGDAAWSPDRRQIAYTGDCAVQHGADWSCSVFLMKADGSGKRRLVKETGYGNWVEWAAGGTDVLWPRGPIYATNLATGRSHRLLPDNFPSDLVGMSKDGHTIAALNWQTTKVVVLTVAGQVLQRARTPTGWEYENASVYLR